MTINDKRPSCDCGNPDCLKGSQTFTPSKEQAQPEPVAYLSVEVIGRSTKVDIEWPNGLHTTLPAGAYRLYTTQPTAGQPTAGEPVYQIRGNSGSQLGDEECWVEVSKEGFDHAISEGKEVRLLHTASHGDEEVRRSIQYLICVARRISKQAFAKGTHKVEQELFISLDMAVEAYDAEMRARASRQEVNQ